MKNILILSLVGFFAFAGCKTQAPVAPVLCAAADKAAESAGPAIANALGCANVAAVVASIQGPIDNLKICQSTAPKGNIGNMVCASVAHSIVQTGLQSLPATWQCSGGAAATMTEAQLTSICASNVSF